MLLKKDKIQPCTLYRFMSIPTFLQEKQAQYLDDRVRNGRRVELVGYVRHRLIERSPFTHHPSPAGSLSDPRTTRRPDDWT